jgi:hypothetical protein
MKEGQTQPATMTKKKGVKRINLILEKGKESERRKLEMTMQKQLEEDH